MIKYFALNINHFKTKVVNFREICHQAPIDVICVDEIKLDSFYPDSQFHIDGYQFPPFRRDRNKYGGGKIVYVREGFITKRLVNLEGNTSETIGYNTFSLANLISSSTCFKALLGTSIDVFLSNRTRIFHNTAITETGISDHDRLITSFFRSHFERILSKKVEYRNHKKFDVTNFLRGLDQDMIQDEMYKYKNDMYSIFSDVYRSVLDRYASLKK